MSRYFYKTFFSQICHCRNIDYGILLILGIVSLITCSIVTDLEAASSCNYYGNNYNAFDNYRKSQGLYASGKYGSAEAALLDALNNYSNCGIGQKKITVNMTCTRQTRTGFGITRTTYEENETFDYDACSFLHDIRLKIPPRPVVILQFVAESNSLIKDYKSAQYLLPKGLIDNKGGESNLDGIQIEIEANRKLQSSVGSVAKGKEMTFSFKERIVPLSFDNIIIRTKEKYGFGMYEVKICK